MGRIRTGQRRAQSGSGVRQKPRLEAGERHEVTSQMQRHIIVREPVIGRWDDMAANAHKQRILVLCTGNSCRSQIAEGWLKALYGDRIEACSAGSNPAGYVHPLAIRVMQEAEIDIRAGRSKHMMEFINEPFDTVITVCDPAREACPVFPGRAERLHRTFDDPAAVVGSEAERLAVFRRVRDEIRDWMDSLFGE